MRGVSEAVESISLQTLIQEAREFSDSRTSRAIGEYLYEKHGDSLFTEILSRDAVLEMLITAIHSAVRTTRSAALGVHRISIDDGKGGTVGVIRMGRAGRAYWSANWAVGGGEIKETRDLTVNDLEFLVRDRQQRRNELRVQVMWLLACIELMREHKVDRLGQLEAPGVPLPVIEVDEE